MRLPHFLIESLCFLCDSDQSLVRALGEKAEPGEADEIARLVKVGLPPVTSINALATMFGYNPGFVWSMINRPLKHYRNFEIPKGTGKRSIWAPRVGLKAVQKWLSFHFNNKWTPDNNVFGFVRNRSHILAAHQHLGAKWVYSIDIENFFDSITRERELGMRLSASAISATIV